MADSELDTLKRKLAAREGVPGHEENVRALKARIAEIEASTKDDNAVGDTGTEES